MVIRTGRKLEGVREENKTKLAVRENENKEEFTRRQLWERRQDWEGLKEMGICTVRERLNGGGQNRGRTGEDGDGNKVK